MSNTFYLKENDTVPILQVTLKNPDGSVFDLTGYTEWKLHILLDDQTIISRDMTVVGDPANGTLQYAWLASDWTSLPSSSIPATQHKMEYEVNDGGANRATFPNNGYDVLRITPDIA